VPATEDGLITTETWETIQPGIGTGKMGIFDQVEFDSDHPDQIRRKEGYEHVFVTDPRPERPA